MAEIKPFVSRQIYTVEVQLNNNGTGGENLFKDIASGSLLNPGNTSDVVIIRAIETYYDSIYAIAPSGQPVVTQAQAANLVTTFRVGEDEPLFEVPYLDWTTQLNFGIVKELFPTAINLLKSSIICRGAIPVKLSAMLGFHYERLTAKEYQQFLVNHPIPRGSTQLNARK